MSAARQSAVRVHVQGVVQGVGFRPFVFRLADALGVRGWVLNGDDGVRIHAEASAATLAVFIDRLKVDAPPAAQVRSVSAEPTADERFARFEIRKSKRDNSPTVYISPDLAVCDECLREMRDRSDPRAGYAYINCTNCGPRYSIIQRLPYDRPFTTMRDWPLCDACCAQYETPADRRFHAQPVACPRCGPTYALQIGAETIARGESAIRGTAKRLAGGEIVGVKGIGGYHVACDARNERAVTRLRERKFRKEKPFAVMVATLEAARELVACTPLVEALLTSTARPIVLADAKASLPGVAPGRRDLGVMLPNAPLHHLLFDAGAPSPLVLTSANRSDEPIAYEDADAARRLAGICDALLVGERAIARRVDDSVVTTRRGRPFMVRRSRGFAPLPVARVPARRPILAVGGDLKNSVALAIGGDVYVSQHIGDLEDAATQQAMRETIDDLLDMYAVGRGSLVVAHDAHPQYVSTRISESLPCAQRIALQHHRAHIASVLAERGEFDRRVVGIALDGTGWGDDDAIWGGEVFVGSVSGGFERREHMAYVPMPGGDAAARLPVQAAAAYLANVQDLPNLYEPPFAFPERFASAVEMVRKNVRCFPTSSTGRLFDAAAAVLGFARAISFEGQAAAWLEILARDGTSDAPYDLPPLQPIPLIRKMVLDRMEGVAEQEIARRFHATLAHWFAMIAKAIVENENASCVVLSGGVFQNALLLGAIAEHLDNHAEVLWNETVPVNDGGLCLGQAALAAFSKELAD